MKENTPKVRRKVNWKDDAFWREVRLKIAFKKTAFAEFQEIFRST